MPNLEYWHYVDRPDLFAAYVVFLYPSIDEAVTTKILNVGTLLTVSTIRATRWNVCSLY